MKRIILFVMPTLLVGISIFMAACEKHDDPFSTQNNQPIIADFRFLADPELRPDAFQDSLRIKPGKTFKLHLEYEDREFSASDTRKLEARFSFESGSGKISHDKFSKPSADGLTFGEAPGTFKGDLLFTPDASGVIRVQLRLFDGVKLSATAQASATFFENLKPIPSFTVRLLTQTNPYRIEFNPERSQDRDGDINKAIFIWSFGDNSKPDTVLGRSFITHEYGRADQYRVRLRVTDDEGKADSTEQFVTTNNQPPRALLSIFPLTGKVPLEITYNARGSFDPDGAISSYQVFFGDGESAQNAFGKHTFTTDKNYQVLLIVKDNLGLADTTNVTVRVATPPIAELKITPDTGGPFPLTVVINGKGSTDPHPGGGISANGYLITITNQSNNNQQFFPQDSVTTDFTTPANYLVTLEVTNIRGLTSRVEKVVPATNLPPVADFKVTPPDPRQNQLVTFNASTSRDPNVTDTITNYRWLITDIQRTIIKEGRDSVAVSYTFRSVGTYPVKLIVTDRFNATGEKEFQLQVRE
jgi:hypothetical protein